MSQSNPTWTAVDPQPKHPEHIAPAGKIESCMLNAVLCFENRQEAA